MKLFQQARHSWTRPTRNNNNNMEVDADGGQQCHIQGYKRKQSQIQETKEIQMLKVQVADTKDAIVIAAEMSQGTQFKESTVNRATDGAILSLNAWVTTCNEAREDGDQDALDIAEEAIYDEWDKLQKTDETVYNLTINHRDFMIASLYGKAKKYERKRMDPSKKDLFAAGPKTINKSWAILVTEGQKYDQHIATFEDPNTSKTLQQQHAADLNRNKHRKNGKKKMQKQYKQREQSQLYFTKSGRNAQFKNKNTECDEDAMHDQLMGNIQENAYDMLQRTGYNNAVIMLSKRYALDGICKPFPCEIVREKGRTDHVYVRPAYPKNDRVIPYPPTMIKCDIKTVTKYEKVHGKLGKLGYPSIEEQQRTRNIPKSMYHDLHGDPMDEDREVVLKVGAMIDARDLRDEKWYEAEVVAVMKSKGRVKIHYVGYSPNYDEWVVVDTDSPCIAQRGAYTIGPDVRRNNNNDNGD
eukprot:138062_1